MKRFTLRNQDPRPTPRKFTSNAARQTTMFSGMNCLAGQQDLFETDRPMPDFKALTVVQPHASMLLVPSDNPQLAQKPYENRPWVTRYRGPLLIHAGKKTNRMREIESYREHGMDCPDRDELPLGRLIGWVRVVDCVAADTLDHPTAYGPYCWCLEDPHSFSQPIELVGKLGLFNVPAELLDAVTSELPQEWR